MSYSRWSHSRWYTYHSCSDATEDKDELFCVANRSVIGDQHFTHEELSSDMDKCLNDVREFDHNATDEEIAELKGYMEEFVDDINRDYLKHFK